MGLIVALIVVILLVVLIDRFKVAEPLRSVLIAALIVVIIFGIEGVGMWPHFNHWCG